MPLTNTQSMAHAPTTTVNAIHHWAIWAEGPAPDTLTAQTHSI
jgi:hypothetical protein